MRTLAGQRKRLQRMVRKEKASSRWYDWRWQVQSAIRDIPSFERLMGVAFDPEARAALEATVRIFPLAITPYYLSLIDVDNLANDPVYRQAFPSPQELTVGRFDRRDPLAEEKDSPVPGLSHRYPDRVLLTVSNVCAMYCRHCTRKRKVGDHDCIPGREELTRAIAYIRETPAVRDVLLSGGDPFMLADGQLEWLLRQLRAIPHVEIIRIGTRTPVVLPYRVTDELVAMLRRYQPVWINTHFNHPREITASSREALRKLADGGFPLGNQSVLLAGVNDCPRVMKTLVHKLVQNRVRPYYLYQCDMSEGLTHFRTRVGKGIEIMERMIGHTSGFAVPTYVIDAPGGGGKIPVMPNYLISWCTNKVVLRNYEGVITTYNEPDSYEEVFCDRQCDKCRLTLPLDEANEAKAIGLEKLMCHPAVASSLVPEGNERLKRRRRRQ